MAHLLKKLILIFGFTVFLTTGMVAQGRYVTVCLKDGSQNFGELVAVRDSVVLTSQVMIKYNEFIDPASHYMQIALVKDIDSIVVKADEVSYTSTAASVGSTVAGGAVFLSGNGFLYSIGASLAGSLVGGLLGWGVSEMLSDPEEIIVPANNIEKLKNHARFDSREPGYVRDIMDNLLKAQQ